MNTVSGHVGRWFKDGLSQTPEDVYPFVMCAITPWKYDIDIFESSAYGIRACPMSTVGPYCDKDDHIWVPLEISGGPATDAFIPRLAWRIMVSKDKGLTWEFRDLKYPQDWPGPRSDCVTLADGTIVEAALLDGFERHPRSQIKPLEKEGYDVWDLGMPPQGTSYLSSFVSSPRMLHAQSQNWKL